MALDPSIILGAKPVQFDMAQFSPVNNLATAMKFKQADQDTQLNALKMQEYERARAEEEGLRNYLAEAMVEETFEQEFGIWDLSQFLGIISLFEQPELEFHDKYMEISNEAGSSVKYFYCEPKLITSLPPKALNMPAAVLQFPLTEKKLQELQKASSVLQVSDMSIYAEDGEVFAKVCDSKDNTPKMGIILTVKLYTLGVNEMVGVNLDLVLHHHLKDLGYQVL